MEDFEESRFEESITTTCLSALEEMHVNIIHCRMFLASKNAGSATKDMLDHEKSMWSVLEVCQITVQHIVNNFKTGLPRRWTPEKLLIALDKIYENTFIKKVTENIPYYPSDLIKREQLDKLRAIAGVQDSNDVGTMNCRYCNTCGKIR